MTTFFFLIQRDILQICNKHCQNRNERNENISSAYEFNKIKLLTDLHKSSLNNSEQFFYEQVLLGISHMDVVSVAERRISTHILNNDVRVQMNMNKKYDYFSNVYFNIFTSNLQEKHLDLFYHIQKIYHGFVKLARLYKYRRAHIHNTCDLVTIPFSNTLLSFPTTFLHKGHSTTNSAGGFIGTQTRGVWSVLQNGSLYFFNRRDLIQILNSALGHAPNFFAEPLHCKNPYNNVIFTVADLYNMYFFIRCGDVKISSLIHEFHACNFQLEFFKNENEYQIREYAIKNFVTNGCCDELHEYIIDMLEDNIPTKMPHNDFPKENLAKVMRPFLKLYLCSQWIPYHKKKYSVCLHKHLFCFYRMNPTYGRKIITKARTMFGDIIEGAEPIVHFVLEP